MLPVYPPRDYFQCYQPIPKGLLSKCYQPIPQGLLSKCYQPIPRGLLSNVISLSQRDYCPNVTSLSPRDCCPMLSAYPKGITVQMYHNVISLSQKKDYCPEKITQHQYISKPIHTRDCCPNKTCLRPHGNRSYCTCSVKKKPIENRTRLFRTATALSEIPKSNEEIYTSRDY